MYINSIYVYNGLFYIIVYMNIYLKYSMVENTPLLWNTFESIPLQYTRKHFFLWNTLRSIQCNICEIMPLVYA